MDIRNASAVDIYVQAWTPSAFAGAFSKVLSHTQSWSLLSAAPLGSLARILTSTVHCLGKLPATAGGWVGYIAAL